MLWAAEVLQGRGQEASRGRVGEKVAGAKPTPRFHLSHLIRSWTLLGPAHWPKTQTRPRLSDTTLCPSQTDTPEPGGGRSTGSTSLMRVWAGIFAHASRNGPFGLMVQAFARVAGRRRDQPRLG